MYIKFSTLNIRTKIMSSSTDNADNTRTRTCTADKEDTAAKQVTLQIEETDNEDKEGDDSTEDVAAKQLTLKIKNLSIENEESHIATSTNTFENIDNKTTCAACGKEGEEFPDNMNICNKCKMVHYCNYRLGLPMNAVSSDRYIRYL